MICSGDEGGFPLDLLLEKAMEEGLGFGDGSILRFTADLKPMIISWLKRWADAWDHERRNACLDG